MQREVTDGDGVRWTLIQALAAVSEDAGRVSEGDAVTGKGAEVRVVCTPSKASRTVDLVLEEGWHEALSDEELLALIDRHRADAAP